MAKQFHAFNLIKLAAAREKLDSLSFTWILPEAILVATYCSLKGVVNKLCENFLMKTWAYIWMEVDSLCPYTKI
eukprot:snap_masked-scaffold_2-processed-gene-6.26-mRNA-1 protein AED:1.00 eAED:1.00 QI:0/0/0/0/1/1/2/0/73